MFNPELNFRIKMSSISYRVDTRNAILTEIVSGLYICGVSELTRQNITKYGITLIINATSEVNHFLLFMKKN